MGKKRKSVATSLDEVDRTMYSSFSSAANSLSHLYTQAMHQQKLTFQAGERHGLEKLHQWLLRQQEGGSRLNTIDILSYLQTELECHDEEPSMSSRGGGAHQNPNSHSHSQATTNIINIAGQGGGGFPISSDANVQSFPSKQQNFVFSNALSSSVQRSLQSYHHHHHIDQGGFCPPNVSSNNETNNNSLLQNQNRNSNSYNTGVDSSMDMHYSPHHDESTTY